MVPVFDKHPDKKTCCWRWCNLHPSLNRKNIMLDIWNQIIWSSLFSVSGRITRSVWGPKPAPWLCLSKVSIFKTVWYKYLQNVMEIIFCLCSMLKKSFGQAHFKVMIFQASSNEWYFNTQPTRVKNLSEHFAFLGPTMTRGFARKHVQWVRSESSSLVALERIFCQKNL